MMWVEIGIFIFGFACGFIIKHLMDNSLIDRLYEAIEEDYGNRN